MSHMSYDITAKGYQEIEGQTVKVFYGLETSTGNVVRQTSAGIYQPIEVVGKIEVGEDKTSLHEQFEAITGLKPFANDMPVVTTELDEQKVVKTAKVGKQKAGKTAKVTLEDAGKHDLGAANGGVKTEGNLNIATGEITAE